MADEPVSLIDSVIPSQGMPLGGLVEEEIEIEEIEEPTDIFEEEDGSVILNFEEMVSEELQAEPDANLAEVMDERVLMDISSELVGYYEDDKSGRQEWEDAYTEGLDLLGIKYQDREEPFRGSSGVTHPLIAEAVTQFQAQAYKELLPSSGPVRTQRWIVYCSIFPWRGVPSRRFILMTFWTVRSRGLFLPMIYLFLITLVTCSPRLVSRM